MDQQNIIFPNAPLLIVHKGWKQPPPKSSSRLPGDSDITPCLHQFNADGTDNVAVTVLKGQRPKATAPLVKSGRHSSSTQAFTFVNDTQGTVAKDPEVRKLVKSHVMKGVHLEISAQRRAKRKLNPPSRQAQNAFTRCSTCDSARPTFSETGSLNLELSPAFTGAAMSLYGVLPFEVKTRSHKLMNYYHYEVARSLYPLQKLLDYNPAQQYWFPLAITDQVLFNTFLYVSAAHCATFNGSRGYGAEDLGVLMRPVFQQLNQRLGDQNEMSDATIGAVSCLAMVENQHGNSDKWRTHMAGMVEMIRVRGGLSSIAESLQLKIHRAEIDGAVDALSQPLLTPMNRTHPPTYSILPLGETYRPNKDLVKLLASWDLDSRLIHILLDLARFTDAVEYALRRPDVTIHPRSFDEDLIKFQYDLLTLPTSTDGTIQEAARLATIIYLKSITRGFPFSAAASSKIVRQLKHSLDDLPKETRQSPLGFWAIIMGGIASQSTPDRPSFVRFIVELSILNLGFSTWESVQAALQKILWIPLILDKSLRPFWEEVERARSIAIWQFGGNAIDRP